MRQIAAFLLVHIQRFLQSWHRGSGTLAPSRWLLLFLLGGMPAAWAQNGPEEPRTLRAVIQSDSPPTYFRDPRTGEAQGFAVDMMNMAAAKSGLRVSYRFARNWEEISKLFAEGSVDVAPGQGISPGKLRIADFTRPFATFPVVLFARASGNIQNLSPDTSVGVMRGSAALESLRAAHPGQPIVTYENNAQALLDLLAGRVDLICSAATTILQVARESGIEEQIRIVGKPIDEIKRSIAVRQNDPALLAALDLALDGIAITPQYHKSYERWFGKPRSWWTPTRIVYACLGIFLITGAVMLFSRIRTVSRFNRELHVALEGREEAERIVRLQMDELETKNAELERFTYTVSHDLKSPIITIKGFLGSLALDLKASRYDRMEGDLRRIDRAADKMQSLLEDLLELSRIGRMVNPSAVFPLDVVAREAMEALEGSIQSHQATVHVQDGMPKVCADRVRIREVFQNLLENALKYRATDESPRIEVGCSGVHGNLVECFVKDNGQGIDARYHERIFGLFEKLDPATEGTGIGLAIVKRIIQLHSGSIWVESPGIGSGSVFRFTLPNAPAPEEGSASSPHQEFGTLGGEVNHGR